MPIYTADRPGMQIVGYAVQPMIAGMGPFKMIAKILLTKQGIAELKADHWYPLDALLAALREASKTFGPATLHQIGMACAMNAPLPPDVKTVDQVLGLIGKVYGSIVRGDSAAQTRYQVVESEPNRAIVKVSTPWQCDIDRGILEGVVGALHKEITVEHDPTAPCRDKGATSCTYILKW